MSTALPSFKWLPNFLFSVIRKLQSSAEDLEALFLGYSGLLHLGEKTTYGQKLLKQYAFFQHKFNLPKTTHFSFSFARLRPTNFTTLRWVQLAQLLASEKGLLSRFFLKISCIPTGFLIWM